VRGRGEPSPSSPSSPSWGRQPWPFLRGGGGVVAERKCNWGGKEREKEKMQKKREKKNKREKNKSIYEKIKGKEGNSHLPFLASFYCSRRFYSLSELSLGAQKLKSAELGGFCIW